MCTKNLIQNDKETEAMAGGGYCEKILRRFYKKEGPG